MRLRLIFPNQLFSDALRSEIQTLILIEHPLFFTEQPFHVQKLMLHDVSMRLYCEQAQALGKTAELIPCESCRDTPALAETLRRFSSPGDTLVCWDLADDRLEHAVREVAEALELPLEIEDTPAFLTDRAALDEYRAKRPNTIRMADFYSWQRRRLSILMTPGGKPVGGAWSFDAENRKRLPKGVSPPEKEPLRYTAHETRLLADAAQRFAGSPGDAGGFCHPVTHEQGEHELDCFLSERFLQFGEYEDAIEENKVTLYHSRLSAAINAGLLDPAHVIKAALEFAQTHGVPLNSVEGFVRQIIGWREYMRASYVWFGPQMRESNGLAYKNDLPQGFWDASTGIRPVDAAIRSALGTAYTHHIERLMVLGCFLLITETDPKRVYDWFMSLFIDAYDWVMLPNVYAMSQYASGDIITTKPYLCGSNYILKMSHYPKESWTEVWDGLYWRFIGRNREMLSGNQRLGFAVSTYDRLTPERKSALEDAVKRFEASSL